MWDKELKRLGLAVRAGVALGLALVGLWFVGLTTDGRDVGEGVRHLSSLPEVTVSLLSFQTGVSREQVSGVGVTGWGKWVLGQSAWLKNGVVFSTKEEEEVEKTPEIQAVEDPETGEIPLTAPQQENTGVLERTSQGDEGMTQAEGVYLLNKTKTAVSEQDLLAPISITWQDGPQILILHTHGSEAYTQSGEDTYEESDPYRTTDCTKNVVRVGEEMAMELRAHGFRVLHDTNLYDYPSYNEAYDRSAAAIKQWLEQYPSIQLVLDVHRDALVGEGGEPYALVSTEAGKKVAQIMLVLGSEDGGNPHPSWKKNLALGAYLQRNMVKNYTALARPMVLRSGRFNQHLAPAALLVEVGGHGNTLEQAIDGARLWADSAARSLKELE